MKRAKRAIQKVAILKETSVEEVYSSLQAIILEVWNNPVKRAGMAQVPHRGEYPTPEELIAYSSYLVVKQGREDLVF